LDNTLYYSPLFYDDVGEKNYAGINEGRALFFDLTLSFKVRKINFSPEPPKTISVQFQALGNPVYYPFDSYIIAGAVKCIVFKLVKGKRKFLNPPPKTDEALHIKNSILGLFLRKPDNHELHRICSNYLFLKKHPFKSLKKFCNNDDSFILVIERPYFLKFMAIIMGILVLIAAIYIGFMAPLAKAFISIVGYIIGIWGIRSIILGNTHLFLIYIDYYILGLFIIASVGIILRLLWNERE